MAAALGENLEPPMPKRSKNSYLHENQELQTTCTLSMTSQIHFVNKELVSPHNWNSPSSKTYWWITYRHVDAKAKYTHQREPPSPRPRPLCCRRGEGSWGSDQIFKKGEGLTGSQSCSFYIKNKLKSEVVNDKKSINKNVFLSRN